MTSVYCDCCGTVKLAEIRDTHIVIKRRRNGRAHVAVIVLTPDEAAGVLYADTRELDAPT